MDACDRPFPVSTDANPLLSFGQLEAWAETVAWCLKRNGVGAGDVVVAELSNSPAFAVVMSAVWNIGAVFAPVDPRLSAREKQQIFGLAGPGWSSHRPRAGSIRQRYCGATRSSLRRSSSGSRLRTRIAPAGCPRCRHPRCTRAIG
ncbi:AMP-binding protein [Nocardia sp. NPDC052112]|uniref:AMP-binding protein n=1 Tax=Nocardia sp. NPDC052112 TaxID=3155646 RepID=UPI00342FC599